MSTVCDYTHTHTRSPLSTTTPKRIDHQVLSTLIFSLSLYVFIDPPLKDKCIDWHFRLNTFFSQWRRKKTDHNKHSGKDIHVNLTLSWQLLSLLSCCSFIHSFSYFMCLDSVKNACVFMHVCVCVRVYAGTCHLTKLRNNDEKKILDSFK